VLLACKGLRALSLGKKPWTIGASTTRGRCSTSHWSLLQQYLYETPTNLGRSNRSGSLLRKDIARHILHVSYPGLSLFMSYGNLSFRFISRTITELLERLEDIGSNSPTTRKDRIVSIPHCCQDSTNLTFDHRCPTQFPLPRATPES
jgi:hypothetical protein